jgi:hypothetical protein
MTCKKFNKYIFWTILSILLIHSAPVWSQSDDFGWWNERHGWEPGMPSWKRWMIISPGYLGPNALPVPESAKGYNLLQSEFSVSASRHFHPGDPTQDISGRMYLPYANGKIAFEAYGVIIENYTFTEEIRDERLARDKDGKGITQGDFYFGTMIQVAKDRRFPDTLFRIVGRTASGGKYGAARFSDNPGYFFDFSFSENYALNRTRRLMPFASIGFYSWQTNDENNLQNDAPYYTAGLEFQTGDWMMTGYLSGYSGYQKNRDKPQLINFNFRHDWEFSAARVDFLIGLRDWEYQTIRFTYSWKFEGL